MEVPRGGPHPLVREEEAHLTTVAGRKADAAGRRREQRQKAALEGPLKIEGNIEALVQRLKTKRYRATLVRRCDIPKANGTERPLGIPALEDTLVQLACAKLLTAIYEQDFLECSYGYRPGRGALDAVRDLTFDLQYGRYGYLVETDVQGVFDPAC